MPFPANTAPLDRGTDATRAFAGAREWFQLCYRAVSFIMQYRMKHQNEKARPF